MPVGTITIGSTIILQIVVHLRKKKIIYSRLKILKNGVRRGGEHLSDNEIVMILASITELG